MRPEAAEPGDSHGSGRDLSAGPLRRRERYCGYSGSSSIFILPVERARVALVAGKYACRTAIPSTCSAASGVIYPGERVQIAVRGDDRRVRPTLKAPLQVG